MLKVALAPAAVAFGVVDEGRRRFLEAAGEIVGQPNLPPGAPQQRCLDKVVTEDLAAEGFPAGQRRQAAVRHEGRHADDRVVAPVVGAVLKPETQARRIDGAEDAGRELLAAGEERFSKDRGRRHLDQPYLRVGVHAPRETDKAVAGHDAVGVQHHHVVVAIAPGLAELGDVAALARQVLWPVAIEDGYPAGELPAQPAPG